MRDSRLFDSVIGTAADFDDEFAHTDAWRLRELEEEEKRPDPRLGQILGTIRLDGLVGKGGMGTVFEGWDEKLQRKVAVKALSRHYRSHRDARERFLREARLLSKIQHPNICQIHDHVETPEGDYLVLELIHGRSLREIQESGERLPFSEALKIARQLAEALRAAHDRGVAHRDLKPANIMLTDGRVKVLDFGLGLSVERAVEKGSEKTGVQWTESGSYEQVDLDSEQPFQRTMPRLVKPATPLRDTRPSFSGPRVGTSSGSIEGTVAYMSPEQARSEPAGVASDIYSLGLVLQEIFTGTGAYPTDLPLTNQLVRAGQGDTLPAAGIDPDLAKLIERMKSVAPGSRPSAPDVAERLEWIAAKPARRLRAIAIGAFIGLLVAFSAVMAYQRARIAHEATRANREAESARQVTEYLKSVFEVSDPWNAETSDVSARELLRNGTERIRSELRDQPLIRARLLSTMGEINRRLGHYETARALLEESLEIQQDPEADPRDRASTIASIAHLESAVGNYDKSVQDFRDAIELQREVLGPKHPDLAYSILNLGCAEHYRGDLQAAEPLYRDALAIFEEASGHETLDTAEALAQLALTTTLFGEYEEAEELHHRTIAIREALLPPDHPDLGVSYYNLGAHYLKLGKYSEAIPLFESDLRISEGALGPDHGDLAFGHRNLASTYLQLGRLDDAEAHALQAVEIQRIAYRDEHPMVSGSLDVLGNVFLDQGRCEEALTAFEGSVDLARKFPKTHATDLPASLMSLASAYYDQGRYDEAAGSLREVLEARVNEKGSEHLDTARARLALGQALIRSGQLDEAVGLLQRALEIAETTAESSDAPHAELFLAESLVTLARAEEVRGRDAEATTLRERALSVLEPEARTTDSIGDDVVLVEALVGLGRLDEARPLAEKLLSMGFARAEFVKLCRTQGWTV